MSVVVLCTVDLIAFSGVIGHTMATCHAGSNLRVHLLISSRNVNHVMEIVGVNIGVSIEQHFIMRFWYKSPKPTSGMSCRLLAKVWSKIQIFKAKI